MIHKKVFCRIQFYWFYYFLQQHNKKETFWNLKFCFYVFEIHKSIKTNRIIIIILHNPKYS